MMNEYKLVTLEIIEHEMKKFANIVLRGYIRVILDGVNYCATLITRLYKQAFTANHCPVIREIAKFTIISIA